MLGSVVPEAVAVTSVIMRDKCSTNLQFTDAM
jgi:hypothetical protein